ncbi:MAG: hypothetical protein KDE24_14750 [Caldilinea sp.]|nr:hypothetical protein [Caldilinea sp.]
MKVAIAAANPAIWRNDVFDLKRPAFGAGMRSHAPIRRSGCVKLHGLAGWIESYGKLC